MPNSTIEPANSITRAAAVTRGVVACAMHAGPNWKGMEDHIDCRDLGECRVLAVADGVGGSLHGEFAARIAVKAFLEEVEMAWQRRRRISRGVVQRAYERASEQIRSCVEERGLESSPQSTFIGVIELPQRFVLSYVGDGAVVFSVGSVNYGMMLPHTGYGGFLTRVLSAGPCPPPAYLEIDKTWPEGEIVLAGTDGVFPPGQTLRIARDILSQLRERFRAEPAQFNQEQAAETLLQFISNLSFDDNRAVGVILTGHALSRWNKGDAST